MTARHSTKANIDSTQSGLRPAPAVSRFVEAGGLRLRYLDYGSAGRTPMLCVHGGAAHAHWFDFVAQDLSSDYHVHALDQRGHGDSDWSAPPLDYSYERFAADLAEAVEKLALRDFVLVGHSMGGMISLVYAATHPGRVAKLIVVDSTLRMSTAHVASLQSRGQREPIPYATREALIARYRLMPEGSAASPELIRYLAAQSCRQTAEGTWRHKFDRNVYSTRTRIDGMTYWERIRIPALLVKGALSGRITPEIYAEVQQRCPQAELAEVAGSYHHVTLDNPAGFVNAAQAFLTRYP